MGKNRDVPMSAHTPGPWVHVENDDEYDVKHGIGSDRTVATVRTGGDMQRVEANARLIAAAPELLEALKELVRVAVINSGRGRDEEGFAAFRAARAAIAKAGGEP